MKPRRKGAWQDIFLKSLGLRTQAEFAQELGVGQDYVNKLLAGERNPSVRTLRRLISARPEMKEEVTQRYLGLLEERWEGGDD